MQIYLCMQLLNDIWKKKYHDIISCNFRRPHQRENIHFTNHYVCDVTQYCLCSETDNQSRASHTDCKLVNCLDYNASCTSQFTKMLQQDIVTMKLINASYEWSNTDPFYCTKKKKHIARSHFAK